MWYYNCVYTTDIMMNIFQNASIFFKKIFKSFFQQELYTNLNQLIRKIYERDILKIFFISVGQKI